LSAKESLYFRDQFRQARATALGDAEAFEEIVFSLERLGSFRTGSVGDLGQYEAALAGTADISPLSTDVPLKQGDYHTSFLNLYNLVRKARNDALHMGAFARHLTTHAVEVALILEDALVDSSQRIGDFMVGGPVCAHYWQPLSFIRQLMLKNSFSFLPVVSDGTDSSAWRLISDLALSRYLRAAKNKDERFLRLVQTLQEAVDNKFIKLEPVRVFKTNALIADVIKEPATFPVLVCSSDSKHLVGILTAFDLL
jgi:CBS domain-containing protein